MKCSLQSTQQTAPVRSLHRVPGPGWQIDASSSSALLPGETDSSFLFGSSTLHLALLPLLTVKERTLEFNKADIPQHHNSGRKFNQVTLFQLLSQFDADPWRLSTFCYLLRATWGLLVNAIASGLASVKPDHTDSLFLYLIAYSWGYLSKQWDELVSTDKRQRHFSKSVARSAMWSPGKYEQGITLC